jgi:hypothetical protein
MINPTSGPKARKPSADSSAAVDAFMATLEHPFKAEIEALRRIILDADPRIAEGIKWNAPSFRTSEYFATTHLRAKNGVGLILHFGAKVRQRPIEVSAIGDPERLLQWLAPDRAMVEFADLGAILARQAALSALIRRWTVLMDAGPDAA